MSAEAAVAGDDDAPVAIFLLPGALYCATQPTIVTTVLGSCVAVCMWDSTRRIGGVNHFVLPRSRDGDRSARYGDVAIDQLVQAMVGLGSRPADLGAKLFGGANVLPVSAMRDTVGAQNVRLAEERLRGDGIAIKARRTGGETGLLIKFYTASGVALVRPVAS